jgi:ketosteroid isomerase-like protein
MKRKTVAVVVVLLVTLFFSVECFAARRISDEEAIKERNNQFMMAWKLGDPAGVAAVYAEDAIFLYPHQEPIVGRTAIEGFLDYAINTIGIARNTLITVELKVCDSIAWEYGNYELYMSGASDFFDKGPYIVIWYKIGTTWFIYRDILNSSMP